LTDTRAPAQINLLDPDLYAGDPLPTYGWLRRNAPVYWDETNRIWGISRWRDVMDVEKNTARYSSGQGSRPLIDMDASMINKDDPAHSSQRKLVSARFTPSAVRKHEAHIRGVVTDLIDAVATAGAAEVVRDLAAPLPAMVIGDLLGFERSQWDKCRWWSETSMAAAGYVPDDPRTPDSSDAMLDFGLAAYELVEARRAQPRDDLISAWVHAEIDGEPLSVEEIINEAILLLDGGAETTRAVIGQTVLALIEHPAERQKLLDDPSRIGRSGVEEFIRWVTPILNMRRTVTEDHDFHGQQLHKGDQVLLMYGAANRDPDVFDQPESFDVTRANNHHVAFGFGTHFCLGANLARLELRVMFDELLRRLPDFRLAPGVTPELVPGYFTRTLRELPIEFTPSTS
jgi:cytochrome P450 family 142 subfamily A polypeptide 1